jgi:DNA-binding XRE family transcriptional regulator
MIPINPQTILSPSGEELVVLSRAEFDALARAAQEALEDADDIAIFDERTAALKSGADAPLPAEVSTAMLRGDSLLRALRRWRRMTQAQVASRADLVQGYLSDLEKNRKTASTGTLQRIAAALDVDPTWLGV